MRIVLVTLLALNFLILPAAAQTAETDHVVIETQKGLHDYYLELATNREEQRIGLMNRFALSENGGMLFLFGDDVPRFFWMKDTYIPLDIIFIDENGVVQKVHENAKPHDTTHITSDTPVPAVIELYAGQAKKMMLKPGDKIYHSYFGNSLDE